MDNFDDQISRSGFPKELMEIKSEELVDFMSSFENDTGCPICSGDMEIMAAALLDEDNNHAGFDARPAIIGMTVDERPELGLQFKTPSFGASCTQCGFISYHMLSKFMAWKKKNETTKR